MVILVLLFTPIWKGLAQTDSLSAKQIVSDGWWQIDKVKHFSTSFYLTTTGYYLQAKCADVREQRALAQTVLVTISLALTKELFDCRKPGGIFSWRDLACDFLGICSAALFIKVAT